MEYVDYLIVGIVLASIIIGYLRGFFPEILAIATWVGAVWAAMKFGHVVEPMLEGKLGSAVIELWAGRLIIGISVLLVGGLVGQLVALIIDRTGLTGTNRTLGLVFGLVRGAAVVGMLVIFAQLLGFSGDEWWEESSLLPYGEQVADTIRAVLPDSVEEWLTPADPEGDPEAPPATGDAPETAASS